MMHIVSNIRNGSICRFSLAISIFFILTVFIVHIPANAATAAQKSFQSPEEAVKALIDTLKAKDQKELIAILGPGSKNLISSGDEVADNENRDRFVKLYEEKNKLEQSGENKAVLYVGNEDWPLPIPLVKKGKSWFFNTKEGKQEIISRRIGQNELSAIQVCLAFIDAQREYAVKNYDGDEFTNYARKFVSEPGKKDGLYWETKPGEEPSPLGPFIAAARIEGYTTKKFGEKPTPYHGYYYKILTAQGKNAPGGARSYMVNNKMIGGFALVAYPAVHGNSGIMTFMVNQDGKVYEKNLGKTTSEIIRAMKAFNPDKTWKIEQK